MQYRRQDLIGNLSAVFLHLFRDIREVYHKQKQGNCTADIRQLYPACLSVGAIVFMSDFLMGRTFQNIGWLIVLLIPIKLAVCIIMLKFEIRAAYSLSTIYSGRGWLSRRLFCLCTAAPAMTMWLAALFAAAALAGNGAVPRKVLVIAIVGLVYTALFSSVLGYKCTVNE